MKLKKNLLLLSLPLLALSSCNNKTSSNDYSYYSEYNLTSLDDFYNKESSSYYVYLYFDTCPSCKSIKEQVLYYFDYKKENSTLDLPNVYLYNMKPSSTEEGQLNRSKFKKDSEKSDEFLISFMDETKPNKTEDTYFMGVPALYKVTNNEYEHLFLGTTNVVNELENYYSKETKDILYTSVLISGSIILTTILYSLAISNNKKENN